MQVSLTNATKRRWVVREGDKRDKQQLSSPFCCSATARLAAIRMDDTAAKKQ